MLKRVLVVIAALVAAVSIAATMGGAKAHASGSTCTVATGYIFPLNSGTGNGTAEGQPYVHCGDGTPWHLRIEFMGSGNGGASWSVQKTATMPGGSCGTGTEYANGDTRQLIVSYNMPAPHANCSGLETEEPPANDFIGGGLNVNNGSSGWEYKFRYTFLDDNGNTLRQVSGVARDCCDPR